jgi:hypothetical protein
MRSASTGARTLRRPREADYPGYKGVVAAVCGGRIAGGQQLVEAVPGGRIVSGRRDVETDAAQARRRHTRKRRLDCVATMLEIVDPAADEIGARQVIERRVSANAHALIVGPASYVAGVVGRIHRSTMHP